LVWLSMLRSLSSLRNLEEDCENLARVLAAALKSVAAPVLGRRLEQMHEFLNMGKEKEKSALETKTCKMDPNRVSLKIE
jgi:hypothetical protein